jgi:hypothetical protein
MISEWMYAYLLREWVCWENEYAYLVGDGVVINGIVCMV